MWLKMLISLKKNSFIRILFVEILSGKIYMGKINYKTKVEVHISSNESVSLYLSLRLSLSACLFVCHSVCHSICFYLCFCQAPGPGSSPNMAGVSMSFMSFGESQRVLMSLGDAQWVLVRLNESWSVSLTLIRTHWDSSSLLFLLVCDRF